MFESTLSIAEQILSLSSFLSWSTSGSSLLAEVPLLTKWLGYLSVGLQVAAGLGFVIFVHELGHFLAAKTFGVKCEKFYVGFDVPISLGPIRLPRTLGRFRWGETEYGIGIVPLGGYVKMLGQDDDPRNAEEEAQRSRLGEGADAPLDPRSYQAKPVWQRMIIISAGVVMNVIFAVFLAAIAFLYGVPYTPTVIGSVPLGSPAWTAGLQPGDQVLQVGKMKEDNPYLRFEDMGGKTVIHGLKFKDAPLPFTIERDGNRLTINTVPSNKLHPDGFYLVGISPATVAEVGGKISPFSYLASQDVDLRPGDQVIAVDGQPLPVDETTGQRLSPPMTDAFQAKWNKPVELTILRPEASSEAGSGAGSTSSAQTGGSGGNDGKPTQKKTAKRELKVTLPPVPVKSLGIGFAIGPISAIQRGSLAETHGLKVGDVIEAIDGEPVQDALRLPMQIAEKLGKPIEFTLRRPAPVANVSSPESSSATEPATDAANKPAEAAAASKPDTTSAATDAEPAAGSQQVTVTMTAEGPAEFGAIGEASAQLGLPNFGIAYEVTPKVSSVDPAFEKASSSLQVGDEVVQFKLELTPKEVEEFKENGRTVPDEAETITSLRTVPAFHSMFQYLPEGIHVRCFVKRGEAIREIVLPLQYAHDWYWIQRGVPMEPLQLVQKTANVGQAMSWGAVETGRRLGDVFEFLTILVTGRASPRNLAGPFGIAEVAASEASNSPSRLLLFLTLLSANLAILNFLPIPALDGGHLMFLIAEAIRGKPLNEALQVRLTMVGVICLLGLMAFAILNDILRKVM